jgi:hypothetical protein
MENHSLMVASSKLSLVLSSVRGCHSGPSSLKYSLLNGPQFSKGFKRNRFSPTDLNGL